MPKKLSTARILALVERLEKANEFQTKEIASLRALIAEAVENEANPLPYQSTKK